MAVMARDSWTDVRLDDLNAKVDRGFESVDWRFEQVDKRFEQVDTRLARIEDRLDTLHRTQVTVLITICGCMFTGFCGLLAAQIWA
jgi:hypothetical protein